jgi:hypothetical protein
MASKLEDTVRLLMSKPKKASTTAPLPSSSSARPLNKPDWMHRPAVSTPTTKKPKDDRRPAPASPVAPSPDQQSDFEDPHSSPIRARPPVKRRIVEDDEAEEATGSSEADGQEMFESGEDIDSEDDQFASGHEDNDPAPAFAPDSPDEPSSKPSHSEKHRDKKQKHVPSPQKARGKRSEASKLQDAVLRFIMKRIPTINTVSFDGESFIPFSEKVAGVSAMSKFKVGKTYHLVSPQIGKFRLQLAKADGKKYAFGVVDRGGVSYTPKFNFSDTGDDGFVFMFARSFRLVKVDCKKINSPSDVEQVVNAAILKHLASIPTKGDPWFSEASTLTKKTRAPSPVDDDSCSEHDESGAEDAATSGVFTREQILLIQTVRDVFSTVLAVIKR